MTPWWWSWGLTVPAIAGFFLCGDPRWPAKVRTSGWAMNLAVQGGWYAYAFATRQWGFIASATMFAAVFGWNLLKNLREKTAEEANAA